MLVLFAEFIGPVRGSAGDFLIVIFIYSALKIFFPLISPPVLSAAVLCFSFTVEFIQLLHLDRFFSKGSLFIELTLGTTFDPVDLVFYSAGCAAVFFTDKYFLSRD
ncbi:MAG: DUF2809 domain-containing protein [Spirochaetes bacterium]|nr:DUF2809 domain-containing protein [Spirochaetota bacterium]